MTRQTGTKLNRLLAEWPPGTVAVQAWLSQRGVSRQLAEAYRSTGWLQRLDRGVYGRAGDSVDWTGAVYAFQEQLGMSIHPAAKTALLMQGHAHFLPLGRGATVWLFGSSGEKLPAWFRQRDWDAKVRFTATHLLPADDHQGLTSRDAGGFTLTISAPERAALELLHLVPNRQSFEEAHLLFQGLTSLRPRLVRTLLEQCRSVKVKRLFMFLAESLDLPWARRIDLSNVDFGKGKRVIVKGGRFDPKYRITVPVTDSGGTGLATTP